MVKQRKYPHYRKAVAYCSDFELLAEIQYFRDKRPSGYISFIAILRAQLKIAGLFYSANTDYHYQSLDNRRLVVVISVGAD